MCVVCSSNLNKEHLTLEHSVAPLVYNPVNSHVMTHDLRNTKTSRRFQVCTNGCRVFLKRTWDVSVVKWRCRQEKNNPCFSKYFLPSGEHTFIQCCFIVLQSWLHCVHVTVKWFENCRLFPHKHADFLGGGGKIWKCSYLKLLAQHILHLIIPKNPFLTQSQDYWVFEESGWEGSQSGQLLPNCLHVFIRS